MTGRGGGAGDQAARRRRTPTKHGTSTQPPEHGRDRPADRNGGTRARERLEPAELARVCAGYDLGAIRSVREFPRGSSRAPKAILDTERGTYLLKRRVAAAASPARLALGHAVQAHLIARDFPLPRLVAARAGRTAVELDGHVYELFEFVAGNAYDGSAPATEEAGRLLARFHRALRSLDTRALKPPTATYHNSPEIPRHLERIARAIPAAAPATELVGSSRVDLQACKLEYSIVSPK